MLKVTDIPVIVAPTGTQFTFSVDVARKFCVLAALASGTGTLIAPEFVAQAPGAFDALIKRTTGSPKHIDTGFGVITGGGGVAFTFIVAVFEQPVAVLVPVTV